MSGGIPADTAFNALTVRLVGVPLLNPIVPVTGGLQETSTLQFTENPDDAIEQGIYNFSLPVGGAGKHVDAMVAFINVLLKPVNVTSSWGFMGLNPQEPKLVIASWTNPNPGTYTIQVNGQTWQTGDRVVVTGANPVFNKTWTILVNGTAITFKNPPVSGHTLPTGGYARRVYSGTANAGLQIGSTKAFYGYTQVLGANPGPISMGYPTVKVSKKNPGRQFLNVSFRSRRRRER